jgi:energy-coupling factor transporter transmembrane protein EcfT
MTSDKFVYLFGRIIPSMSLLLSMTLRFVPRFIAQIKVVSNAQKCVGRDASNGGVVQRVRNAITILSIMVTWALENAIETADSMKSRGYGLRRGRRSRYTGSTIVTQPRSYFFCFAARYYYRRLSRLPVLAVLPNNERRRWGCLFSQCLFMLFRTLHLTGCHQ